ncbi:MAG TPA: histidine--tRNA ligase [Blastocatellia bacterium]
MDKIKSVSGFPEWLPDQQLAEQYFINLMRERFDLFGFSPMETRAVEPLDYLLKKGETDKEIYVLRRLQATESEENLQLGLHYDLTVPFARYIAQNRGRLVFPVRRYQIQKVWRGERPQEGRYREFYQADIDVIAEGSLDIYFDAEVILAMNEVVSALPMPPLKITINNRKILEGFYTGLGIQDIHAVLRTVDKLDKIGENKVAAALRDDVDLDPISIESCLALARIKGSDAGVIDQVLELGVKNDILMQGLNELRAVMELMAPLPPGTVEAGLRIARGFDYYTGTVYEAQMTGHEDLGAVCSGGRYDNLASVGPTVKLPGVGVSMGITRILGRLFSANLLRSSRRTPSCVLVALTSDETRGESHVIAMALRARGIPCEVHATPAKYGKQIRYADQKGIPFVWFPRPEGSAIDEVRDIRTATQTPADRENWNPPPDDLHVKVFLA